MTEDTTLRLVMAVMMLVLVGSALISRAIPMNKIIKMALAWAGIFALFFLVFSFIPEMKIIGNRMGAELNIANSDQSSQHIKGKALHLRQREDGHYWLEARINGKKIPFLIDSGATMSSLSMDTASRAGLDIDQSGFPVIINTANGQTKGWRIVIDEMSVDQGMTMLNQQAIAVEGLKDINVLGMSFLSQMKSWRVENGVMILDPQDGDISG